MSKSEKKHPMSKYCKTLWISTVVCIFLAYVSGFHIFFAVLRGKNAQTLDGIFITETKQYQDINLTKIELTAGQSQKYEIEISSPLVEHIYYTINFKNHIVQEDDKNLYISVSSSQDKYLLNNTLYQIFNENLAIENVRLPDTNKDILTFTFSLPENYSGAHSFGFMMSIYAEGRPVDV